MRLKQTSQEYTKEYFEWLLRPATSHSNSRAFQAFENHLIGEHAVESLKFYEDAARWRAAFSDTGIATASARARKIIRLYVVENALFPCNLPYTAREHLVLVLGAPGAAPPVGLTLFDEAMSEMRKLMFNDAYARCVRTPEFQRAVKEDVEAKLYPDASA